MGRLKWTLAVGAWLLASSVEAAVPPHITRYLRMSQARLAAQAARTALDQDPDSPDLHAALGVAFQRSGFDADAVVSLGFGEGSRFYESTGLEAHAEALRSLGLGAQAAELRAQRLALPFEKDAGELTVLLGLVDDRVSSGELDLALDWAESAVALFPRSPAAHAYLAQVAWFLGEVEQAEYGLWWSQHLGSSQRGSILAMEMAIARGDLKAAREALDAARDQKRRRQHLRVLHARLMMLEGDPEGAVLMLESSGVRNIASPENLAVRAWAMSSVGMQTEAREALELGQALYPGHPWMLEAAELVQARP